jgi:hypothetical protein
MYIFGTKVAIYGGKAAVGLLGKGVDQSKRGTYEVCEMMGECGCSPWNTIRGEIREKE